jgi:hypothetical protein
MTDKTRIFLIEIGQNVIVKENEGHGKDGKPKQERLSNFRSPATACKYLIEKFGLTVES